jgi:hypothetical protein
VQLNDPQATYAFDLAGLGGAATSLDPPPTFASTLMATEMAELYWLAVTRDVPFRKYEICSNASNDARHPGESASIRRARSKRSRG